MFDFLAEENASICGGSHLKRREFLQIGALGAAGLSLPQLLAAREHGAITVSYTHLTLPTICSV